jgi:peroxiredoxin
MERETYNALTWVLGIGAWSALVLAIWQLVATIVGWRGAHRKRRLVRFAVLLAAVPVLVGAQQFLLWRVFLPSLGRQARDERQALYDEAGFAKVGQRAPAFAIEADDGRQFALDKLRGKVVVVNFFATWCGPCLAELPHVEQLWNEYRERKDFALLVVGREETAESVTAFKAEHGFTFPMAADPKRAVYGLFAKEFIPRMYLISPDGTIRFACTGYDEQEFARFKEALSWQLDETQRGPSR